MYLEKSASNGSTIIRCRLNVHIKFKFDYNYDLIVTMF